jgi:hypothetical protein
MYHINGVDSCNIACAPKVYNVFIHCKAKVFLLTGSKTCHQNGQEVSNMMGR